MHFAVTILGNNSAIPAHGRHPTSQVVTLHDHLFLVDCGEGTQMQLSHYNVKRNKIKHIFISHLHGDHYFGLVGLLNSFGLQNRAQPLHIYGPEPLQKILQLQFECANTTFPFELHFHPLLPGQNGTILETSDMDVSVFPTQHRIPCFGFLFKEKHHRRKINPEKAQQYKIPFSYYKNLQRGADYQNEEGEIIKNAWVTTDPPVDKKYAFCADTQYDEDLLKYISGCDLIYHEATYLHKELERAEQRYHSTSRQAALLASKADVSGLLIGHFSSKYPELYSLLEEARQVFKNTQLAEEGATYLI